ncbi:coiled coil domain-containing protein [Sulfurospirillum diekertiae]|uniref:Coiled coil domain-containing protein n=1 Tax=Sulfurospirillum diekertiae TaxID=1854492 RepID=A0A6G9VVK9_9BACT|nr:coiled coil domain-containing protein [Sulfurospirillum diekertiae]QIR77050.1 coiled coil domain-containing protein [Sulfurospirillum diekertiae]QIR79663.1 coiled coil domain-containing protein [Sulfurospirillum diekertiae]
MSDKKLYEQKIQAEFDTCKAQVDKFKAEASGASANAQIEMHKQIKQLEEKMSEGKTKLQELADASEEKFDEMKKGVESIWQSTKSTLHHASKHFGK